MVLVFDNNINIGYTYNIDSALFGVNSSVVNCSFLNGIGDFNDTTLMVNIVAFSIL